MALTEGSPNFVNGVVITRADDVRGDRVPVSDWAVQDLLRSEGMWQPPTGTAAAPTPARYLTNQLLSSGLFMVQTVVGAAVASFTTRTALGTGTYLNTCTVGGTQTAGTLPAGILNKLGRSLNIKAWGIMSANATPDYTIDFAVGAAGATVLGTTGAVTTTAITGSQGWYLDAWAICTTAGATGKLFVGGTFTYGTSASGVTKTYLVTNSTPGTAATVDLTAALALNTFVTSSASHASNSFTQQGLLAFIAG